MSGSAPSNYVFSPGKLAFFAIALRSSYEAAGAWPSDAVAVSDVVAAQFAGQAPPSGQVLGLAGGMPAWVAGPAMTPAQQAAALLTAGCAIVCTSTPSISATYALDATTMDQIGSLARDCAAGLGFPLGAATFSYPDITGANHSFTPALIQEVYKALRDYTFGLDVVAKTLAAGGTASWPAQPVTIA